MPCLELEESREKKKRNENERKMGGNDTAQFLNFPFLSKPNNGGEIG